MIFAKNFARNHEKNNTWNIRRLVYNTFVPTSKPPSVLYCKLMDFFIMNYGKGNIKKKTFLLVHMYLSLTELSI